MNILNSSSDDSTDLTGMMRYSLSVIEDIRDRLDNLAEVSKAMAKELQVEPAVVEKLMPLVLDCRQGR